MKFGAYANSNMLNSMVMFISPVLDQKHTFWANLVQKIKIVVLLPYVQRLQNTAQVSKKSLIKLINI